MENKLLEQYIGKIIIADMSDSYLAIGTLKNIDNNYLELENVDLHDHKEANCTKDIYAIETKDIGVRANRENCLIPKNKIIAISLLEDII